MGTIRILLLMYILVVVQRSNPKISKFEQIQKSLPKGTKRKFDRYLENLATLVPTLISATM